MSSVWNETRNGIIKAALRKTGAFASGEEPSAQQITDGAEALNALVKAWHADGMPVWAMRTYTFQPVQGVNSYTIGTTGQDFNTEAPLKVTAAYRHNIPSNNDVPMNIITQDMYNNLAAKNNLGVPVELYYQPLGQTGIIKLYPTPDASVSQFTLFITYQRPFEDFNTATDVPDFPSYWDQAIIYNLAHRLAPEYGLPIEERNVLAQEAKFFHDEALSFGTEEGSFYIQPMRGWK